MQGPVIAVTAAAGKTGSPVVKQLLADGLTVRALVRGRDARSEALASLGAEVVETDLFNGEDLCAALRGVRRAYFCPPIDPYVSMAIAAFAYAAEVNRLESVVAMSQWLASPHHPALMTRDMWLVEQLVPRLPDAAVTILNPGFFVDNYLRVSIGTAAQLGLYPNFVADSKNVPPSNDDMARVAAGVLANPDRHAGKRYRVTGPALIDADHIVATLSRVLGRNVRRIDAPEWLLAKVARLRGEPPYAMSVFRYYLEDHRQGAFALGGPTEVVRDVTGRPAETFEQSVRAYAALPSAQRTSGAFSSALTEFALAPLWPGYDHAGFERSLGIPQIADPLFAMQDEAWIASHSLATTAQSSSVASRRAATTP